MWQGKMDLLVEKLRQEPGLVLPLTEEQAFSRPRFGSRTVRELQRRGLVLDRTEPISKHSVVYKKLVREKKDKKFPGYEMMRDKCRKAWKEQDERLLSPEERRDGIAMVMSIRNALDRPFRDIHPVRDILDGLELSKKFKTVEERTRLLAWVRSNADFINRLPEVWVEVDVRWRLWQAIKSEAHPTGTILWQLLGISPDRVNYGISYLRRVLKLQIERSPNHRFRIADTETK